jgi:hypothetical protein
LRQLKIGGATYNLRHSFASVPESGSQSLVVIGKMLGCSKPATTAGTSSR